MRREKRFLSFLLLLTFVFGTMLNTRTSIGYAKAIAIPTPIVSGVGASYMVGDKLNLKLTAAGIAKNVQYRVVISNNTTKRTVDLFKGYTPKYYNPKYAYPVTYTFDEAGKYTISISAKLGGYKTKYSKTIIRSFNVISNASIIDYIDNADVKVNVGDEYSLPKTLTATMKDGSTKEFDVAWETDKVDTSNIGTEVYFGNVKGYNEKVQLTLKVVDEKIVSIEPVMVFADEASDYTLPERVTAKLNNGTISVKVKWDDDRVDTSKPGAYKYEGTVDGFEGKAALVLNIKPVELKLNSIDSSNLREIKLNFNKMLDIESIKDSNFRMFKGTNPVLVKAWLEDNKTIVISPAADGSVFDNKASYVLVVDGIKDVNGNQIERMIKDIMPIDAEAPSVKSVKVVGPASIEVEFSEPIKSAYKGAVEFRSGSNTINSTPILKGFNTNKIRLNFLYGMNENVKYELRLKGFRDFTGKENVLSVNNISYAKDRKPIEAKVIYGKETYVAVKFNKEVRGITKEHFYNTVLDKLPLGVYTDYRMVQEVKSYDQLDTVWVKFYDSLACKGNPFYDETDKLGILGSANKIDIRDNWGNPFDGKVIPLGVKGDKKAPQVSQIMAETESSVVVAFSERVKFNASNLEILDEKGLKISSAAVSDIDGIKYRIELERNFAGHRITVNIKDVYDTAVIPNKLDAYTNTLEITDKTPPQVVKVVKRFISGLDQSLYVYFNEALDEASLSISNYCIHNPTNNLMSRLTEKPVFFNGNTIVRLSLTNEQKNLIESEYHLVVSDVRDIAKNSLPGQVISNSKMLGYNSTDNKPRIVKLEAVDKSTLVITFNQYLKRVDKSVFILNGETPSDMKVLVNDEGNTVVTLKAISSREFQSDLSGIALLNVITNSDKKIENEFGICVDNGYYTTTTPIRIEERMPPALKVVNGVPQIKTFINYLGVIDAIVLEYEENIDMNRLSALSYSVSGRTVTRVYTNSTGVKGANSLGRFVVIELKAVSPSENPSPRPVITQILDIYDTNENKLSPTGKGLIPQDFRGPSVIEKLTGQITRGETKTIRFSKPLNQASKSIVEATITAAARGKGTLVYNWTDNSILSITNIGSDATDFILTIATKVNVTDIDGNSASNLIIIGL